jgi:hypothetical protein
MHGTNNIKFIYNAVGADCVTFTFEGVPADDPTRNRNMSYQYINIVM